MKNQLLKPLNSEARERALSDVVRLRSFEYYARYADYTQRLVTNLQNASKEHGVKDWSSIGRKYAGNEIAKALEKTQTGS